MRARHVLFGTLLIFVAAACDRARDASPAAPSTTSGIELFAGTWTSLPGAAIGVCSSWSYAVTPTGPSTGTITYTATCAGVPITGSGSGTVTNQTLNWTANGTAGSCPFNLAGTSVAESSSTSKVTYAGTVCGAPVSGTDTLRR
jgi:hypothetical protein